jgi:fermentation-respiration switch protein FrsA (DUF1100 family)
LPVGHAEALFEAAPEPKRLHVIECGGHNHLVIGAGDQRAASIARCCAAVA